MNLTSRVFAFLILTLIAGCRSDPLESAGASGSESLLAAKPAAAVYRVSMTNTGGLGLKTDCSPAGYVLAHEVQDGDLNANGSDLDANGQPGPDLFLDLLTDVNWTRKYDTDRGLSGILNGCYGETAPNPGNGNQGYSGNLFMFFETRQGQPTIRFTWHFDYFLTSGNTIREHFTLQSGYIPFPAWTSGNVSGRVAGEFQLAYYLKEGKKIISLYEPLPGGTGLPFEFDLDIARIN